MSVIKAFLNGEPEDGRSLLERLSPRGLYIYPTSVISADDAVYFMGRSDSGKIVGIVARESQKGFEGSTEDVTINGRSLKLVIGPTSSGNAAAMREALPFLAPSVLGLQRSVGCGDRLGLATPGHLRSVRKHDMFAPILAQQSIREMRRTGRSPQEVMDDALWGALQEGWLSGFGADADHLKTFEDVDRCVEAGFSFFTIDPSDYVDDDADRVETALLDGMLAALPWDDLDMSWADLRRRYVGRHDAGVELNEEELARAAVKYGSAVAHTVRMFRHLAEVKGGTPFELEMSVDETENPTSPAEHFFVASELDRLGVKWVSLAPRFVGRMEKGVDYIGALDAFEQTLRRHVEVARAVGPYKLSLHSGSDKFSLYPIFARHAGNLFHLKTAGTSYLEALRAVSRTDPDLFREILEVARERYEEDKASYHISAELSRVPASEGLADSDLRGLLEDFDSRQVLHVTFGSILTDDALAERLKTSLQRQEEVHYEVLERHFDRHLDPFG